MPWEATQGNTRIGQETEGVRGKLGKNLYYGFRGKEQMRLGKQV